MSQLSVPSSRAPSSRAPSSRAPSSRAPSSSTSAISTTSPACNGPSSTEHAPKGRLRRTRGFTLVELMVVVVILGSLIALVGPNVWRALFTSRMEITKAQLSNFGDGITQYKLSNKKLPNSLEELTETTDRNPHAILDQIPLDPWGNEYEYRNLGRSKYTIKSAGEDGEMDTEDDIVFPDNDKDRK